MLYRYRQKTDDIYKYIVEHVETRFDTSNYELDRPLTKRKNKKVTGLRKDELDWKIMKKCVGLRAKAHRYLIDDGSEDKKAKGTKRFAVKIKFELKIYKKCWETTQLDNKINSQEKN